MQFLHLLGVRLGEINQRLAGLGAEVVQLRTDRVSNCFRVGSQVVRRLGIGGLVIQLTLWRSDVEIFSSSDRAQRTPSKGAVRIIGFSVSRTVLWSRCRGGCDLFCWLHQARQRFPLHLLWDWYVRLLKERWRHIHQSRTRIDSTSRGAASWQFENQRHMQRFVIEKYSVRVFAMRPQ